jgi:ATPase subunit of ABC transporter with duplicated ATPase domains
MVSHDAHALQCVCDEVWDVHGGHMTLFKGDVNDYKKMVIKDRKTRQKRLMEGMVARVTPQ